MAEGKDLFPFSPEPSKRRKIPGGPSGGDSGAVPEDRHREAQEASKTVSPTSPGVPGGGTPPRAAPGPPASCSDRTVLAPQTASLGGAVPLPVGHIGASAARSRERAASIVSDLVASRAHAGDPLSKPREKLVEEDIAALRGMAEAFREECGRDPENVDMRWRMFRVQRLLGLEEDAKATLCHIVRLEPNNVHARAALARMCSAGETQGFRLPAPIQPFYSNMPGLFAYPFARGGAFAIVGGCLVFSILQLAIFGSMLLGPVGIFSGAALGVFFYGYILGFYFRIMKTSAAGQDHPPDWPDFDLGAMLDVSAKVLVLMLISLAPLGAWLAFSIFVLLPMLGPVAGSWIEALGTVPCLLFSLYYGVMGIVNLGAHGSWESICRIPAVIRSYMPVLPELACLTLLGGAISGILAFVFGTAYAVLSLCLGGTVMALRQIDIGIMTGMFIGGALILLFLALFCFFYTAMVIFRLLGLFYRQVERRLVWS
ncbi:MAG: DUF4013 domain-containing protein [Planctomycetota bacterium]|nr:DUF4013 domain-containing protein [Planctomycetota bacterium]